MANPRPRRQCDCGICKGKHVSHSTWYAHNPGGRKKLCPPLPQEFKDAILNLPETDAFPWARKRRIEEDEDEEDEEDTHTSKRTAGSSSVRMIAYMRLE